MAHAPGANQVLAVLGGTAIDLPAHAQGMNALGPFEIDSEEVVNLAVARIPGSPEAHADRVSRMALEGPVEHVEVMDVLLDDMVAAHPGEAVPIMNLVRDVAHARLSFALPEGVLIPIAAPADKF